MGGLWIGVVHAGMGLGAAASVFTTLTIGDGLVTQVPALDFAGRRMLITRSHRKSNLPVELARQVFASPQALIVAAGFLLVLSFTSLPRAPLVLLAAGCLGIAAGLARRRRATQAAAAKKQPAAAKKSPGRIEDYLTLDPMELELGVGLLRSPIPAAAATSWSGSSGSVRYWPARWASSCESGASATTCGSRPAEYRIKIADSTVAHGSIDAAAADRRGHRSPPS